MAGDKSSIFWTRKIWTQIGSSGVPKIIQIIYLCINF